VSTFKSSVEDSVFLEGSQSKQDPYMAYLLGYTLGSNKGKAGQGNMSYDMLTFGIDATVAADAKRYAERYVHYLHGVNPMGLAYLSNMSASGAEASVASIWTCWFAAGWAHDPPPGFLVPGPNTDYAWDVCCPASCGDGNNVLCGATPISPPTGQPAQKSYKDFNRGWPLDSWDVSEPHNAYQAEYVRLLSKFVKR